MLTLGLKNARSIQIKDYEGKKYLHNKNGKITPIKPEKSVSLKNGTLTISVEGDRKNAYKLLDKTAKELLGDKSKDTSYIIEDIPHSGAPLNFSYKIEITPILKIALNKIALEYYKYCGFELNYINDIVKKINLLDESVENIIFCNLEEEIRSISYDEISHLIIIKSDPIKKRLIAYVELFNVICAYIILSENYNGPNVYKHYHQNALSEGIVKSEFIINLNNEPKNKNNSVDFGILINKMYERFNNIRYKKEMDKVILKIKNKLDLSIKNGTLSRERYNDELLERICKAQVELSFLYFPYLIEDFKEEEDDFYNYLHSNMKEELFNNFCEINKNFVGINITFPNNEEFVFDSFIKQPYLVRNNITLVKVYCVLLNKDTKMKIYLPYRELFEGIKKKQPPTRSYTYWG